MTGPVGENPHAGQPVYSRGAPLEQARAAVITLHGRGSNAADILSVAGYINIDGVAFLAPQAKDGVWYPYVFSKPVEYNEPFLSSALGIIAGLLEQIHAAGIPLERTGLLGFSQGACLSLEYAARSPRRYGGIFALSGALMGETGTPRAVESRMEDTPVFLGCSDTDPFIALDRVEETADTFIRLGAQVDKRIYPSMAHTVNQDEISAVRAVLKTLL